jgi:carbonic anhydrase/acetyltransferase-like protein (isoleucine patch superfamily)
MNFIHPKAIVDEKAELGENVSIWAFAVIRADEGSIKIGDNSNIQEHVTIHGRNAEIGKNVTLGHNAIIHGAKIGNNVLIGMGAIVMDDVEIGDWVIVGAGSLIPPGKKIESNTLVLGNPARFVRKLEEKDRELIIESYKAYLGKIKGKK